MDYIEDIWLRNSFPAGRSAKPDDVNPTEDRNTRPNPIKPLLQENPIEEPHPSLSPARKPIVRRQPWPNRTGGNFENQSFRMAKSLSRSLKDGSSSPSLSRKHLDALDTELEGCHSSFTPFQWKHTSSYLHFSPVLSLATAVNLLLLVNIHCQPAGTQQSIRAHSTTHTTPTTSGGYKNLSVCLLHSMIFSLNPIAIRHTDPWRSVGARSGGTFYIVWYVHRKSPSPTKQKGGSVGHADSPILRFLLFPASKLSTRNDVHFLTRRSRAPDGGRGLPSHDPPSRWRGTGHNKQYINIQQESVTTNKQYINIQQDSVT